jgi:FAT domain
LTSRSWQHFHHSPAVLNGHSLKRMSAAAAANVDHARELLGTELAALVGESYERAYGDMVRVQQLTELEEVIRYSQLHADCEIPLFGQNYLEPVLFLSPTYRRHSSSWRKLSTASSCTTTVDSWCWFLSVSLFEIPHSSI